MVPIVAIVVGLAGAAALLQPRAPLAPVEVALPDGDALERLAALEGRLVALLAPAHEPAQVLERQRAHGGLRGPLVLGLGSSRACSLHLNPDSRTAMAIRRGIIRRLDCLVLLV